MAAPAPCRPSGRAELASCALGLVEYSAWSRMVCRSVGGVRVCVKVEWGGPTGSHKDRAAPYMIWGAAVEGLLGPGGCVAELSSGNTAAAVAWAAAALGLRSVLFVEEGVSPAKKALVAALGGELVEVPDDYTVGEARGRAEGMGCHYLAQHENEYHYLAHYETTGAEIAAQAGSAEYFVMGVGTGATLTGAGARLKEELGHTTVVGVVPAGSPLAGGPGSSEVIEGLAGRKVAGLYHRHSSVVDRLLEVSAGEAARAALRLARELGVPAGHSTGAAYHAALKLIGEGVARPGETIVLVAADHASRYPSLLQAAAGGR